MQAKKYLWTAGALVVALGVYAAAGQPRLFVLSLLNGLTLAALYFLVASGFSLIFGLMRNVNLAHGSLFLLGGYVGYSAGAMSGSWVIALLAGFLFTAVLGAAMQVFIFSRMEGQDLRQTLVTVGLSIVLGDLAMWIWGGDTYQFDVPQWMQTPVPFPLIGAYSAFRLIVLGAAVVIGLLLWAFLNRTVIGAMIRAGVDDKAMLAASGVNVKLIFVLTFAVGAGLAGMAGVVGGSALSLSPGEDVRYLLASLVVVIIGGMGSISGAAVGAVLIGLAETFGLAYAPTYGVVFTFVIMIVVLAFRPQGLLGKPN
ncbi:MAG: transporter ATP-binding protein [Massilia sp.]|nr:transporter ATP-binding protein [Massilia sp.]